MLLQKKYIKGAITVLIIAVLIAFPFYFRGLNKAQAQKYKFTVVDALYYKQISYHEEMNDFFNSKLHGLLEGTGSLEIPEGENCDNNLTTYCVAKEASKMFFAYRRELLKERGELALDVQNSEPGTFGYAIDAIYARHNQKIEGIDNELEAAEKVLDLTIKAYNEFQIAYPLHAEYQKMIKNLERYRGHLVSINGWTKGFKNMFVNATTTACK